MLGLLFYAEGVPSTMHTVNKCEQILFAPIRLLTCPPQENAQPAHAARARAVQRAAADTIGFVGNIAIMTEVDDFHQKNALKGRTCVLAGGTTFSRPRADFDRRGEDRGNCTGTEPTTFSRRIEEGAAAVIK